jgi:Chromosome segregation ATPases
MISRSLMVVCVAALLSGCTYLDQKQDLQTGGPARREAEAQAKLKAAQDKQKTLFDQQQAAESDAVAAREELEAAEQQLDEVSRDLKTVSAELEAARKRKSISDAEYQRLKAEVGKANQQAVAAHAQGGTDSAQKKKQQIEALKKKKAELEKALSMSTHP